MRGHGGVRGWGECGERGMWGGSRHGRDGGSVLARCRGVRRLGLGGSRRAWCMWGVGESGCGGVGGYTGKIWVLQVDRGDQCLRG